MRRAEYGASAETVVRYGIMLVAVAVLALNMDGHLALAWGALYALLESSLAVLLTRSETGPASLRYMAALTVYGLSGLCFMSMPLYLLAADFSPGLNFTGAVGLVGLALYTLQRPHRELGLVVVDCCTISILALALVMILTPRLQSGLEVFTVGFMALAVLFYYIGSQISGWRLQTELRTARQRAAAAQQARTLGQFVGGVAHEFNNDLTVILGNLDLFETLQNPDDRAVAIRESRTAAARAAQTVQHLLAASGRTRLVPLDLPMDSALFDFGEALTDVLKPDMTVEVVPSADPLVVRVDSDALRACVIQLGLNAQEATSGSGLIRIRAERRATAGELDPPPDTLPPYVALIIEDDGPGVSDEALSLLAEPFYSTKPPNEGRGLGLSAVAGFTRQSGGGLKLEHGPGGGLRVVLYLAEARGDGV
ncbi:His Kinase A (phospho-acceptor) domain-containing protein [Antarctobacter heliothermus]|uniref:histidine kinase n=2 Tax=Antarctobacter heliothermus TaxID=74033 RepID=A0A239AQU5_9RHOB|nr:His Kinase A (phospho-acceptor) domain-containing protein [Antarctobacter heliothermus]